MEVLRNVCDEFNKLTDEEKRRMKAFFDGPKPPRIPTWEERSEPGWEGNRAQRRKRASLAKCK